MNTCDHKPDPGYRELKGAELEEHYTTMEAAGFMTRVKRTGPLPKNLTDTCCHVYVKAMKTKPKKKKKGY